VDSDTAFRQALAVDAFGCHFLTDLFASGHVRVPRRVLGERYGILRGALYMSLRMHNEDNEAGLWCETAASRQGGSPRQVWRAYGDGMLASAAAACHRAVVKEAVRRSAEEVFRVYRGHEMPPTMRAETLLPIPLPPGASPEVSDTAPLECPSQVGLPNGWPMYAVAPSGRVVRRDGPPTANRYRYVDDVLDVHPDDRRMMQP
jgi:hypothetical protein